jgi:multimeric flavodoxin WrbA
MNVVGVVGSPKKAGNTALLVEAVLDGAREVGHDTTICYLSEFNISPLTAENDVICYPQDDMGVLYPHIERMDALVLGTPIYYDHISARTKLFIDRLHYYSQTHGQEYYDKFPRNVKLISIITYEWDKTDAYDAVVHWINERMNQYWKMQLVASLKAEGTHKTPVSERYMLLMNAKELGRTL